MQDIFHYDLISGGTRNFYFVGGGKDGEGGEATITYCTKTVWNVRGKLRW